MCYCWGATSENRLKVAVFAAIGLVWLKISGRSGRRPPPYFLSQNWVNDLSFIGTRFFRFVTNHAFDRHTDRRTYRRTDGRTNSFLMARLRCVQCMQRFACCAVKLVCVCQCICLSVCVHSHVAFLGGFLPKWTPDLDSRLTSPRPRPRPRLSSFKTNTKTKTQDLQDQYWKSMTGMDCDK